MKKITIAFLLLCSFKYYTQDCSIFLKNIEILLKNNAKIEGKTKEDVIIQTKYFIACKGEVIGLENPVIKNLEKLIYITPFFNGKAIAQTKENLDVIIDENFTIVKTLNFTTVRSGFSFGLAQVNKRSAKITLNDKWGYIDTNGDIVIPIIYDDVWGFEEGISKVQYKNKQGYINTTGKEIIPVIFKYAWNLNQQKKGMILVQNSSSFSGKQKDFGLFDKFGNVILKPIYDDISFLDRNGNKYEKELLVVTLKGKKYYVNSEGEYIKDFE